jgi:uncharacterized protein with LGFP repeats
MGDGSFTKRPNAFIAVLAAGVTTAAVLTGSPTAAAPLAGGTTSSTPTIADRGYAPGPVAPSVRSIPLLETPPIGRAHNAHGEPVIADSGQRSTAAFSMIGVTWSGTEDVDVEVRVRSAGHWTDWQHLEVEMDGPDASEDRLGTVPLWVGDADGAQARLTSDGAVDDAEVALIESGTSSADASIEQTLGVAVDGPARPRIVSRAEWGADESLRSRCDGGTYTTTVRAAFVHHTAGTNSYSSDQSAGIVRGVYAYHTQSRGWCDVGYNFLVDKYGTIFEGRRGGPALPVLGAHTGGYNANSFGVSLMGNFETATPTSAIMNATVRIVAWKLAQNYRNPVGQVTLSGLRLRVISGHRDTKSTACPGQRVYDRLPWIRDQVDQLVPAYSSQIYDKWRALGGESGFVRSPFRGEHPVAGGTLARFGGADIGWRSGSGAHEVHGKIRNRWRDLGSARGRLGFPTTDEQAGTVSGVRLNVFTGGRMYWTSGVRAQPVWGAILNYYRAAGAERSRLRLPTSTEYDVRDGVAQNFERARMYWSQSTRAHPVWGAIQRRYDGIGAHRSRLRLPSTDEYAVTGGVGQRFTGGRMYWSSGAGAHAVWGAILRRYVDLGGADSRLRLPTSDEYAVSGGIAQNFQGGRIRWDRETNTTTVRYT